ncbi:SURF1 family protein [Microbulbifer sp. TRSA001]|uniref:SURF1 family protein n=1 Tax=Microbulbifer sp. TRSA001 TaxID=3243381 RepID=UPI0040391FBD
MIVDIPSASAKDISLPLIRNWPITIFSLGAFILFIFLGLWQLDRAKQKVELIQKVESRLSLQPQEISNLSSYQEYASVTLAGVFQKEIYFLDNRTRNGRVGYEVLQVFSTENTDWLVNRGWIPSAGDRDSLPEVTALLDVKSLQGYLYPIDTESYSNVSIDPVFKNRIQQINSNFIEATGLVNNRWSIRLFADSGAALITDWNFFNSGPEKHQAYAFQWFTMAIAIWLLWAYSATNIIFRLRRRLSRSLKKEFQNEIK